MAKRLTHITRKRTRGFSLLEIMAVIVIMLVLVGTTVLTFANSRESVKVKTDAASMIAFLRNMWDHTKTSGAPLILQPNFEKGSLAFTDPRTGRSQRAEFTSDAKILAVKLNDRYFSAGSGHGESDMEIYEDDPEMPVYDQAIFISEGRGLTRVSVVFGIVEEEEVRQPTFASLNLITGKGNILLLEPEDLVAILDMAQNEAIDEI